MLSLAVALAGGSLLFLAMWGQPRRAFVIWLLSMTMIPPWVSLHILVAVPFHCLIAVVAVGATIFHVSVTISKLDLYFGLFISICFGVLASNGVDAHSLVLIAVNWVIPYLAARVLVAGTGTRFAVNAVAITFSLVGALAIVERALDWHPFVGWDFGSATAFQLWQGIQLRSGAPRSEWAFGHSIALGGSLALAIPFVARSSHSARVKTLMFILIGGGVFAAASRGATVAAILTAAICIVNAKKLSDARALSFVLSGVGLVVALNFLLPALETLLIGTDYGDRSSALYRNEIYSTFLPRIEFFAPYDAYAPGENVESSIDSAVLDIGLRFGWLVLFLAAFPLLVAAIRVLAGSATLGEIALVGQLPVFATAAFITQYQNWIFIVAGISATMLATAARTAKVNVANPSTCLI